MRVRFLALLLSGCVLSSASAYAKVRTGDRAAELSSVKDGAGRKLKLKKFRGRVVVLTFGASWCKPCAKELPAYERISKKFSKKDVVFVAVNIDNERATGKRFMKRLGVRNVIAAYDPRKGSVDAWDPPTMPSTFVIGKRGIVRHVHKGFERGDEDDLVKVIAKYD